LPTKSFTFLFSACISSSLFTKLDVEIHLYPSSTLPLHVVPLVGVYRIQHVFVLVGQFVVLGLQKIVRGRLFVALANMRSQFFHCRVQLSDFFRLQL
jgi:hypothetical protein